MVTAGHCRKCQLISNGGVQAAETGQSPSLSRQTFSWWNMPHSLDSPQIADIWREDLSSLRFAQGQALSAAKDLSVRRARSEARAQDDKPDVSPVRSREAFSPNVCTNRTERIEWFFKSVQRVAHGLSRTVQVAGNFGGALPSMGSQQNLASAQGKGSGRA